MYNIQRDPRTKADWSRTRTDFREILNWTGPRPKILRNPGPARVGPVPSRGPLDGTVLVPAFRGQGLSGLEIGRGRGRPRTANFEFSLDVGGQGRPGWGVGRGQGRPRTTVFKICIGRKRTRTARFRYNVDEDDH